VTARKALAWTVHAYTASGLVLAGFMAVLIVRGGEADLRLAFLLMWLATLIDATDGWLARRVRAKEALPAFDGRRLDDIVDFHTYTSLPLFLLWRSGILPGGLEWFLLAPLLASAYGFSQVHAKTPDGAFLGFPSYWNVVAFYVFFLWPPAWLALGILGGFALLTFVPVRYAVPAQVGAWGRSLPLLGVVWAVVLLLVLLGVPEHEGRWVLLSLAYPLYYLWVSWLRRIRRIDGAPT
jgi:phosphatidylcholine synthase